MKNLWYGLVVVLLAGITIFCVKDTVCGQEKLELAAKEQFYREQEQAVLRDTEELLEQMGYVHCGITLNRVVEGNTNRLYTFTIHHRKIDRMDEEERQVLSEKLRTLTEEFPCASQGDNCEFTYSFFIL